MATLREAVLAFVAANPGTVNGDIRQHLVTLGFARMTRKELNQQLYAWSPDHLRWLELEDQQRGWWLADADRGLDIDADGVLVLNSGGRWTNG